MYKFPIIILLTVLLFSCGQKKNTGKQNQDRTEVSKKLPDAQKIVKKEQSEIIDPDPDDGVPPEEYSPHNSNIQVAAKIRKFLTEDLLKDDLKLMSPADRRFKYEEVDLNGDGNNEYIIGFENSYFCGTGGCTYYLLNNDGSVITIFSVSRTPFIALSQKTNGWKDLLVESDGAMRILKFNGKTYPSNPSMAPKFTETPSDDAFRLLWDEFPIPTFKF